MAGQVTAYPPFEPPIALKKTTAWAERKVPDGYSDGDKRHWPGGPQYRPAAEEFYLCVLGQKWAEADGIAQPGVQYYLDKLPDGYAMFGADQPGGPQTYRRLFGHPDGRFYDSAIKFVPHFLWLMSGMEGDCECNWCAKKNGHPIVPRKQRPPREAIDPSILSLRKQQNDLTTDDENDSSRGSSVNGIASRRTHRQVRQPGAPQAVDEEGNEDIYKDCIRKLENGGTRGVEIDLTEEGSIDWNSEQTVLPQYLTQIEQQHCFVPRTGELVLWCPTFLDDHYLMLDDQTREFKFYSFEQKCFHGFPAWRAGLVTATPNASVKNGPIDFPDILDTPPKKTAFNTAGFRIETMPDPNDDMNKSMSKQYKYVPLKCVRPLGHWQALLKGIPPNKLHPSILNALTCMTSICLLGKYRFNGDWPSARIFCKAIYLGSELITVGDTIRLIPSKDKSELTPDVLVVTSIRYNLQNIRPEHSQPQNPYLCGTSWVSFVGSAYTTSFDKVIEFRKRIIGLQEPIAPLKTSEIKTLFRSVGAEEYGQWYPWHEFRFKYEVSHEQVAGRLCEADAVRLWTGQRQGTDTKNTDKPDSSFDIDSILAGRRYATATDARLPEPQSTSDVNWFFADTRAQALAVATVNGIEVGNYYGIRTPLTMKQWRMQVKIADGQPIAPGVEDEFIRDLTTIDTGRKRGRPPGSRVVDGKLVRPGQKINVVKSHDEEKHKPSSQMAGAALITDSDETSEEYSNEEGQSDDPINDLPDFRSPQPGQAGGPNKPPLTKADIMSSIEVPGDEVFDDDVSDADSWLEKVQLARGGTEESSGGDYRD